MMKLRGIVAAIAIPAILVCSGYVKALGLGAVTLKSKLHQPLRAEIVLEQLNDLGPTEIFPNLASIEDFEKAGVQRPYSLTDLRFRIEMRGDGTGIIHATTTKPIQEPFLNFLLEINWPNGRLLREYTLLMDPPSFTQQQAATVQPPRQVRSRSGLNTRRQPYGNGAQGKNPGGVDPAAPQYAGQYPANSRAAASTHSYQVRANDTLWQVAERVKPGRDVSVQQAMLAIQYLNPDAFLGNNINRLKKGVVLRVPDRRTALAVSFDEALWEVSRQNRAFHQRPGSRKPQLDARRQQQSSRPVGVSGRPSGKLSIVSSADSSGEKGKNVGVDNGNNQAIHDELLVTREQLDKLARENNELKSQLQELSDQIETLNKLITLKNNQMAALQASESSEPAEVSTRDSQQPQGVSVEVPEPVKEKPASAARKPAPVFTPETPPEPGFMASILDNPLVLLMIILIPLAGAGGYMVYRRRQSEGDLSDDELIDLFELEEEQPKSSQAADFFIDDDLDFDENPSARPKQPGSVINEADTHIAHGRFDQAAAILDKAVEEEPGRTDLRLKLLEVHSEANDINSFKQVLSGLEQMGDQNALAQADTFKVRFPPEAFESQESDSDVLDDFPDISDDFDLDDLDSGWENIGADKLDLGEARPEEGIAENAPVETEQDTADTLEFNLDDLEEPASEPETLVASDEGNALEFNMDGLELNQPEDEVNDRQSTSDNEMPSLDFDTSSLDLGTETTTEASAEAIPEMLNLDMETQDTTGNAGADQASRELSDFASDLNFDELLDEDIGFLDDADEVSTKLDLARAYIDMGDRDGASEILDEVMEQGSDNQQEEARELLDQL